MKSRREAGAVGGDRQIARRPEAAGQKADAAKSEHGHFADRDLDRRPVGAPEERYRDQQQKPGAEPAGDATGGLADAPGAPGRPWASARLFPRRKASSTRWRSSGVMMIQSRISSMVRLQPRHQPVASSIWQTLMQGEGGPEQSSFSRSARRSLDAGGDAPSGSQGVAHRGAHLHRRRCGRRAFDRAAGSVSPSLPKSRRASARIETERLARSRGSGAAASSPARPPTPDSPPTTAGRRRRLRPAPASPRPRPRRARQAHRPSARREDLPGDAARLRRRRARPSSSRDRPMPCAGRPAATL